MYKILIIASTENILNYKNKFSNSGIAFDYLISEKNSTYDFGDLNQQKIYVNDLMIPVSETHSNHQMTVAQQQIKKHIQPELKKLDAIIHQYSAQTSNDNQGLRLNKPSDVSDQIYYFDQMIDLKLNLTDRKIHLEMSNSSILVYDHIYIEESYLLFSKIEKIIKLKDLLQYNSKNAFQFIGISFHINSNFLTESFWLLNDSNYKSVYDNFHFINKSKNTDSFMIDVWSWLPVQQIANNEDIVYLQSRLKKRLEKKFDFLSFKPLFLSEYLKQPINTYLDIQNNAPKLVTLIPSFHYCSEILISNLICSINESFFKKIKIKKENILKINAEADL